MKLRDLLFWMHLCAGVVAGVIIFIMSFTGALLVFEHDIVESAEKNVRFVQAPSLDAAKLSLNEILAKAKESKPKAKPAAVSLRSEENATTAVSFGKDGALFLNPYTGEVLGGDSKVHQAMHVIEDWHRWLGNREQGRPITGACNFAFFILAVTGFYLWWPKKWSGPGLKAVLAFNPKLTGKARDWNWHNVIGFWTVPFLIIITATGIIMSYPWANDLLYRMAGSQPPPPRIAEAPAQPGKDEKSKEFPSVDVDKAFAAAQDKVPNWVSINIRLPQKTEAPVSVSIEEPGYLHPRSVLTLDSKNLDVKKWEPASEQSTGRKWRTLARYLHTGEAAGLIGQIIGLLACIGGCFLVWTGFAMAWNRFSNWRGSKKERRKTTRRK